MVLKINEKPSETIALRDSDGYSVTYGQLRQAMLEGLPFDTDGRQLVFILCENSCASVTIFLSCLQNNAVPLLLNADIDRQLLLELVKIYTPSYYFAPMTFQPIANGDVFVREFTDYKLMKTMNVAPVMHDELAFLMSTSGSTGSPKLVRHSIVNIDTNVKNVVKAFNIKSDERAIAALPIHFTQGLSTVCSNLYAGARVLLTGLPLTSKEFWEFMKKEQATSFSGVPYSFEIMYRLRFFAMDLPHLKVINQGGGRLTDDMFIKLADYMENKGGKFIATYGATETTSRMAFLPPEMAVEKTCSIGISMHLGEIHLINDDGIEITAPNEIGELVYSGENVAMGYAVCAEDLAKEDEWCGVYNTKDLAKKDEDGYLFIVGRKSRFAKIFGYRVNLDEIERIVKDSTNCECACIGTDDKLVVLIVAHNSSDLINHVLDVLIQKTKIHVSGFSVKNVSEIPKSAAGKTLYAELDVMC